MLQRLICLASNADRASMKIACTDGNVFSSTSQTAISRLGGSNFPDMAEWPHYADHLRLDYADP
jgi:hypothetical protein